MDRSTSNVRLALVNGDVRFGNRRVVKMYDQINELRRAINAGDMTGIQEAWSKVEEHIDFAYQHAAGL